MGWLESTGTNERGETQTLGFEKYSKEMAGTGTLCLGRS